MPRLISKRPGRPATLGAAALAALLPMAGRAAAADWMDAGPTLLSPTPVADAGYLGGPPDEHMLPFYDVDWSLGVKGQYIHDSQSGDRLKALVEPSVDFSHTGNILTFHGGANAQLSKTGNGDLNIDQSRLSAGSVLAFDPESKLTSNASLSLTQEDPHSPDVASNVAKTPIEFSGSVDSTFSKRIGPLDVTPSVAVGRDIFGPTTLTDGTEQDNTSLDNTHLDVGLRLGYRLSPIVEPFIEGHILRTVYDVPSPSLGTKLDNNLYTLMSGVSLAWDETLVASVSSGVGLAHFDDGTLGDVRATLYDASLTFKPDRTLTLTGNFTTSIGSPGPSGSGSAKIAYDATAAATYTVNDWLDWRASAGWSQASFADSSATSSGYTFGAGADYMVSRHMKISADYTFEHAENPPNAPQNIHTVTVGMTFQK